MLYVLIGSQFRFYFLTSKYSNVIICSTIVLHVAYLDDSNAIGSFSEP